MTKKHFKAVAEIVKEAKEDWRGGTPTEAILISIEENLATYFAKINPYFDRRKFFDACDIA